MEGSHCPEPSAKLPTLPAQQPQEVSATMKQGAERLVLGLGSSTYKAAGAGWGGEGFRGGSGLNPGALGPQN